MEKNTLYAVVQCYNNDVHSNLCEYYPTYDAAFDAYAEIVAEMYKVTLRQPSKPKPLQHPDSPRHMFTTDHQVELWIVQRAVTATA